MAIFRPQEAASWLEWYAKYADLNDELWQLMRRGYLRRHRSLIEKHDIKCCSITNGEGESP